MAPAAGPFVVFLVLATALQIAVGAFLWRRRSAPGAVALTVAVGLAGTRLVTYAGMIAAPDLATKLFFQQLFVVPTSFGAVALLVFAVQYAGNGRWLPRGRVAALSVVPALAVLVAWTNPLHRLMWIEQRLDPNSGAVGLDITLGPAALLMGAYGNVLGATALALLLHVVLRSPGLYRGQAAVVLVGVTVPIAANLLDLLADHPFGDTRTSVFFVPFATAALALGLYRHRLFDVAPVAYRTVVAGMADGVLVLDAGGRIVELNEAAARLTGRAAAEAQGQRPEAVLPAQLADALRGDGSVGGDEIRVEVDGTVRYLDVLPSLLWDGKEPSGRVVVLRDATDRKLRRENARLVEQLERQVATLEESRRRVTAAEERQRREISELLHTRVQGRLLLAWHKLGELQEALEPGTPAHRLAIDLRVDLDDVREREVRAAAHLLHPTVIRMGLAPAIESLSDSYVARGLAVVLNVDDRIAALDRPRDGLPDALRLGAYRVVEEALANAARHAAATRVEIELAQEDPDGPWLSLIVRDDGRGFDPSRVEPGLGLASIGSRVAQLGGAWEVSSQPGRGTTLLVSLPLTGTAPDDGAGTLAGRVDQPE
jgi:PAS domain S-box-containing protein